MVSDRSGGRWRSYGLGLVLSLVGHAAVLAWVASTTTAPVGPTGTDLVFLAEIVPAPPAVVPVEPVPQSEVVPARPTPPRPAAVAPRPVKMRTDSPPVKPALPAGRSDAVVPESALAPSESASAAEDVAPSASVPAQPGRADEDAVRRYAERVWAHLLAHRPRGLRLRGTVLLAFSLSRDGTVTQAAIARPSGEDTLDRAVLAGLAAASPFPPPPAAFDDAALSFTVPVQVR